jgi:NAD(P)-dependent dehydrogenase (short-subunit alcohol dehydrogenase family)
MSRLEGKIAVITGANDGVGLASAKRFVKEGPQVYITRRRQEELDKALQAIGGRRDSGARRCVRGKKARGQLL